VRRTFGPKTEQDIGEWEKSCDETVFVMEHAGEMLPG